MKQGMIDRRHVRHVLAAAVMAALSSTAAAQQPGDELSQDQPGVQSQQEQQDLQSEPSSESLTSSTESESGGSGMLDQIAQEHDDLSTFVEAVKAAGMEDALTGSTEYTVFAPTNDAWEQMSGLSKDELMQPENREQLISLLRAHIVADDVDEEMASSLPAAQTIDGGTVELSASGDTIQVGDAEVVQSGIQQGSLRIYAIDSVLEPTALARADDIGSEQEQGSSEFETERESGLGSDQESGLGSERESGLGSESEPPLGSESESPFGSDRESPFGPETEEESSTESDRSADPFGN